MEKDEVKKSDGALESFVEKMINQRAWTFTSGES